MKNEPAFPLINPKFDGNWNKEPIVLGLTKLEYAAIEAMKGVLSDSHIMDLIRCDAIQDVDTRDTAAFVAGLAVEYAGALLTELEKET